MKYKQFLTWLSVSIPFILPPFLLGGVYSHLEVNFIIIFVSSLLFFCYFLYLLIFKKPVVISTVLIPLIAILAISMFQLVPLPAGLLKILSPKGHYFQTLEYAGLRPLTMSIPDTFYSCIRVLTLMLFSIVATRISFSGNKKIKNILLNTIVFISTVVIFISAALEIIQIDRWLYGNLRSSGFLIEPIIVNPNHAAAFFGISGILALTLALTNDFKRMQIFYGSIFFIHTIAVVSTLSRGGILAYLTALVLIMFLRKKSESSSRTKRILFLIPFIFGLSVAFYTGHSLIEKEFNVSRDGYFDKIENIKTAQSYFSDFYMTGSGLGSFSRVYPYYQSNPEMHFDQLENEPVQFVLEMGIFFSILIFLLFIAIILKEKERSQKRAGLFCALFFILIHNTVDFNLHNFSILFPVTFIVILLAKPANISGKLKTVILSFALTASLALMVVVSTESGRSLCGYENKADYKSKVYLYPADYKVPMDEAIRKMNSADKEERTDAVQHVSSAILKAPNYYFVYYLAGNLMTRLGSIQAVEFYKKSVSLNEVNSREFLDKIYNDLRYLRKKDAIVEVVEQIEIKDEMLEKFLFDISDGNDEVSKYILDNKTVFFMPAIKNSIRKKDYVQAQELIKSVEVSDAVLSNEKKGQLLMFKGNISHVHGKFEEAFNYYLKGSTMTQAFRDYLLLAYCSLNLGKKEMSLADDKLRKLNLMSTSNMVEYYKWLSKKDFKENNIAKGMKNLEKAAELSKKPALMLEVAKTYSRQKMHLNSIEHLSRIIKLHPDFKKEEIKFMYDDQLKKLSDKEKELFKESLLKGGH